MGGPWETDRRGTGPRGTGPRRPPPKSGWVIISAPWYYAASSGERKKIERLFGEAKSILSVVRLRLRGLTGARDAFLLTATVQNLKRLANHTTGAPPQPMMA